VDKLDSTVVVGEDNDAVGVLGHPTSGNLWLRQTYVTPLEVRTYWHARDLKV
jgi:hypothetical protein